MEDLISNSYRPSHFTLEELAPPEIILKYGTAAWWFLEPKILWTADALREYFAVPVYCNWQGMQNRGLRSPDKAKSLGAMMSPHMQGKALDLDIKGMPADAVRKVIIDNPNEKAFQYITRIEMNVSWLHIDCYNWRGDTRYFLFNPH